MFARSAVAVSLALVLLAALPSAAVAVSPSAYSEFTSYDGTTYYYDTYGSNQSTYRATVFGAGTDASGIYMPTVIEGYNVTVIEENAFSGCPLLQYAVIPERISEIKAGAFDCPLLEKVYFLGDAPAIDATAFHPEVEFYCLDGKSGWSGSEQVIETITLSEGGSDVQYYVIEGEAMAGGGTPSGDGTITLSSYVDGTGGTYPVTSVGPYSFSGKENEDNTDMIYRTDIKKVILADGIGTIRERAFYYNTGLISVENANGLEVVADEAFRMSSSFISSELISGENVRYLGFESFRSCTSLKEICISDATVFVGEGTFKICRNVETLRIGTGIETIATYAFAYLDSLMDVVIDGDVRTIEACAFYMDASLKTIALPDSVTFIGTSAFYQCTSLKTVSLGKGLGTIGSEAFAECSVLNNVRIPGTVTAISSKAFAYCSEMNNIFFDGPMPAFGNSVFLNVDVTVHVSDGYEDSWSGFSGDIVVDSSKDGPPNNNIAIILTVAVISLVSITAVFVIFKKRGI